MKSEVKVAILEDDIPIKDLYLFKLKKAGYNVRAATDGDEGLKLITEFQPTLILLDLYMPYMNGDDVLEAVRKEKWGKKIKVIVLTNISEDEAPHKLSKLNVDRYIVKAQYTPKQVVELIKEVLGS